MSIEQILTIVATVLGASGIFKGVEVYIRRRGAGEQPGTAGQGGATLTGPGIVTEQYCRETRKELVNGVKERDNDIKASIDKLTEEVKELGKQFASVEATAIKAANRGVGEHESRFHKTRSTGTLSRPDSR